MADGRDISCTAHSAADRQVRLVAHCMSDSVVPLVVLGNNRMDKLDKGNKIRVQL